MGMKRDLGVIATVNGLAILTTYVNMGLVNGGRPDKFRFSLKLTTIAGTVITSLDAQIRTSKDGVVFETVNLIKDDGTLGASANFLLGAAGTPQENTFTCDGSYQYVQVQVKANGGAGKVGESVVVSAAAF